MSERGFIKQAGLEMTAIVVSVLLALFLNSWWQSREVKANHQKTLALLQNELVANRAETLEAIAYYKRVAPEILAVMPDGVTNEEAAAVMKNCCQIMSGGSSRTSHEMAVLTGLYADLDPEDAASIISAFVGQEDLRLASETMTAGIMTTVNTKDLNTFFDRYYIFTISITPSLEELLTLIDDALTTTERLTGKESDPPEETGEAEEP